MAYRVNYPHAATCRPAFVFMNRLRPRRRGTCSEVRASATFPSLPLLCGSSDVVRARIAKASIACQNIASAVAVFERVILAVPIHTISACPDHRAPRSLGALRVSWTEAYRCKSSGSHQNRAYHHLSTSMRGLVITPRRLSLFQYRGRLSLQKPRTDE